MTTAAIIDCEKAAATPFLPNRKKAKLDPYSVKKILDETVTEIMASKGDGVDDDKKSIYKLIEGTIFFVLAFFGPLLLKQVLEVETLNMIIVYIIVYSSLRAGRKLPRYFMERNVFLFTFPFKGSRFSNGLALSSTLERSSDLYTLTIDTSDPDALSPPLSLTRSISEWFAGDGVLIEEVFKKDVVGLLKEYAEECHKYNSRRYWRSSLLELSVTLAMVGICLWIYVC